MPGWRRAGDGDRQAKPEDSPHPYRFFLGDLVDSNVDSLDFLARGPLPRYDQRRLGAGPNQAPLYIPVPRRWGVSDLVNEIGLLLDGDAAESDVIIFRTLGDDGEALLEEARSGFLLARAKRPVWVLRLEHGQPRLVDAATGQAPLDDEYASDYLDVIRECELTSYAHASGVYLQGDETFHYVGPNGRHYRSFLRVGSMLSSLDAVDSLCFWLTPRLSTSDILLLDSSTILSAGLRSAEHIGELRHGVGGAPLGVEVLRRYSEEEVTLAARLGRFSNGAGEDTPKLAFLESVCSTGGLVDHIRRVCGIQLKFDVEPVPIFCTVAVAEAQGLVPLCHIGTESDALPKDCPLCDAGSQRVTLLPSSYTLEVAADVRRSRITKVDAAPGKKFLDDYAGAKGVSLHRTEADSGRHHMIYVDGGELLESSHRFRWRFRKLLRELPDSVGVVLTPRHTAAEQLGTFARRQLKVPALHLDEDDLPGTPNDLERLSPEWLEALRQRPNLLLIDDVVVTGARLRRYLNALGGLSDAIPDLKVTYVVAVARPDHRDSLDSIPRMLMGRGTFAAVETLVLPHWGKRDCPWCRELKELEDLEATSDALQGRLKARYELLSDTTTGITGNTALLVWDGSPMVGLPRSIFGDGTHTELFVSVAAAVQALRNDEKLADEFRPPIARVLDPTRTFDQTFFEYRIQALILRACRPHDLNSRLVQRDLIRVLRTRLAGDRDPEDRAPSDVAAEVREQRSELMLAAAHDKLPREWVVRRGDTDRERQWIEHVLDGGDPDLGRLLRHLFA